MPQTAQRYTNHLNTLMGQEASFFKMTPDDEKEELWVLFYPNAPGPGHLTAYTYGLSNTDFSGWVDSKPELTLCVQSTEADWALALGHLALSNRGSMGYHAGAVLDFNSPISHDTKMTGFLLYEPMLLPNEASPIISLPDKKINLVGAYPVYPNEITRIKTFGLELFFTGEDYDPYSISRPERGVS